MRGDRSRGERSRGEHTHGERTREERTRENHTNEAADLEGKCPCCDKHCPQDALKCGRGREHFGVPAPEGEQGGKGGPRPENPNATTAEKILTALRRSGHYLHHNFGNGETVDCEALMEKLSGEEQEQLLSLLNKCLENWN